MSQTRAVDALSKNRIVEQYKLFVIVHAIFVQSLKELLTIDLGLVHISTMFGGDVKNLVTTFLQLRQQICLTDHVPQHTSVRSSNQNFCSMTLIERVKNVGHSVSIAVMCHRLDTFKVCLERYNLRTNNAAVSNQFRCRNITKNLTIDSNIIHATIVLVTDTRSCSKVITIVTELCHCPDTFEERLLNTVVCFVVVNAVDVDTTLYDTIEGVIGSEDDTMCTCFTTHSIEHCDALRFSGLEMFGLPTVHMTHDYIRSHNTSILTKLLTELISKQNTRSNNNDGHLFSGTTHQTCTIFHHDNSFATTCRHIDLTHKTGLHSIESTNLVGSKCECH